MPSKDSKPKKNLLLAYRVTPEQWAVLEHYWRFQTKHRHLSDAVRELLAVGAAAKGLDYPPDSADPPGPDAPAADVR